MGKKHWFRRSKSQTPSAYRSFQVAFMRPAAITMIVPPDRRANAPLLIIAYNPRWIMMAETIKNKTGM